MANTFTAYKIMHRPTGRFSSGGSYACWSDEGKTWSKLSHVRGELLLLVRKSRVELY